MKYLIMIMIIILVGGCAGYKVNDDGSIYSYGFLRTIAVDETTEYYENGQVKLKSQKIQSESNTGDVLMGFNEVLGTASGAARDMMP